MTESAIVEPSPGHEKTVSVSTAAPMVVPRSIPSSVITGNIALRSPWRSTIWRSPSPFALAVRM